METANLRKPQPRKEESCRLAWGNLNGPQCLNCPAWFLFFLCISVTAQSMSINGLTGVTTTSIERRFGLTSTQLGWIPSAYELAGIPVLLVIGYLGGVNIHRPRWVAGGMFILSMGVLLYSLPHFVTGPYIYSRHVLDVTCQGYANSSLENCDGNTGESDLAKYHCMFIGAAVLIAIGGVPIHLLGIPYLDDVLTKEQTSLFVGILSSFSVLGPAIAFIGGGVIIDRFYTDFDTIDTSTIEFDADDSRWVGAWWIGFLFCFVISFLVVFPLSAYPFKLQCDGDFATSKRREVQSFHQEDEAAAMQPGLGSNLKDLTQAVRILFINWPFLFTCLHGTCDAIIVTGFTCFGPKFLQNEFGLTAGDAAIIFGAIAVPGGAGGNLFASFLIKRFGLSCSQLLKGIFIGSILVMLIMFSFAVQCENVRFAGVTEPYNEGESILNNLVGGCSSHCGCSRGVFEPVCGSNSITYFSPCFAGCRSISSDKGSQAFLNCSCIESVMGELNSSAVKGFCSQKDCVLMPLVVSLIFIAMFVMFICGVFHLSTLLSCFYRCVPQSQRSLALAVDWMLARGLGAMPGPLLFGAVLDKSCLLWSQKCEEIGSCLYYDTHKMAWYFMAICLACKFVSVIFGLIAWKTYKPRNEDELSAYTVTTNNNSESIQTYSRKKGNNSPNSIAKGDESDGYNREEGTKM